MYHTMLCELKFYKYLRPANVRHISQFLIEKNDCVPNLLKKREVIDPNSCRVRDRGLVLGVYFNEFIDRDQATLTAAAEQYDKKNQGKLWNLLKLSPFPRLGEARVFFDVDPDYAFVAVAGLGTECLTYNTTEKMDESKEAIRVAAGVGARALQQLHPAYIDVESFGNAEAAAEGAALAVWHFTKFRSESTSQCVLPRPVLTLYNDCDFDCWNIGILKAQSQNLARYLQELPANLLIPKTFSKLAVDLLCDLDINVEVKTQGWAIGHEMGGFVSIGKSSIQPPLYVEISYYGTSECVRPIVLIGKGVTFDSGSIDLKPPEVLRYMRGDMAGAACVLSIVRAAALLKLPINIRGILPLCELMPGGRSPKFGDVVNSGNGKTVHVRIPSHEGRLIIADSLVYARNYWPQFVLDIGTMSPELLDTLGNAACACYSNSEELFNYMEVASGHTGDRIWRMPLWNYYSDRIKDTNMADVANAGRHRYGDSPNCAAFLRQFLCDGKWVHLDTYNVSYTKGLDFPYLGRGMTGRPTRTVIELIYQMLADGKLCK